MYSREFAEEKAESKNKYNKTLFVSLVLNLIIASGGFFLLNQNHNLDIQLSEYALRYNEVSKKLIDTEQQLNFSQAQLDYYKELTSYYSSLPSSPSYASGIIGEAEIPILAVQTMSTYFKTEYKGNVLHAKLELQEGEGRILVNTEVFNGIDIQTSVRTATKVIESLLGVSFDKTDVVLTITTSDAVEAVDGPSAGGAITVALIAALENMNICDDVYMTGTINGDGTVGSVGAVPYKALAAAEEGAEKIIVPSGQATVTLYEPKTVTTGRFIRTIYEKVVVDLEDYLFDNGFIVDVIEVDSVMDAYNIFTGKL